MWQRLEADTLPPEPELREHPFCMVVPELLERLKAIGGAAQTLLGGDGR